MIKPETYVNQYVKCSNYFKFESSTLKIGLKNAQNVKIGYWVVIMLIFNEL